MSTLLDEDAFQAHTARIEEQLYQLELMLDDAPQFYPSANTRARKKHLDNAACDIYAARRAIKHAKRLAPA